MYQKKPSVVIINGSNLLGLEISKRFSENSSVVVVGKKSESDHTIFPKHVSVIDNESFPTIKLSKIKTIVVLYHDKFEDFVSASDLVNHAKFLSDIFRIATLNKAKIILTTSFGASKHHTFAKYGDKEQPYDFPSFQNFIEKLALEQNRHSTTFILRLGDLYGDPNIPHNIIYRILKDTVSSNYIRVDDDGLEKIYPISNEQVGEHIVNTINSSLRSGIYTLAPQEGLTQMTFANLCMQFSSHVSHIKFVKSRSNTYMLDPMYENIYSAAPYLPVVPDVANLEKDMPELIKSVMPISIVPLREEYVDKTLKMRNYHQPSLSISNKIFSKINKRVFSLIGIITVSIFLVLFILMQFFLSINTKLLTDGNNFFFQNYKKGVLSELQLDSEYNKQKSQSLINFIKYDGLVLNLFGSDSKNNTDFLNAEVNYFDALSNSHDYNFLLIDNSSRGIVQIKIQSAKSLINKVDKSKLFWSLKDEFDQIKEIINQVNI